MRCVLFPGIITASQKEVNMKKFNKVIDVLILQRHKYKMNIKRAGEMFKSESVGL